MARSRGPKKPTGTMKGPLTHFLCLPLVTEVSRPHLERELSSFRNAISSKSIPEDSTGSGRGAEVPSIHSKAIRPIGTLHCTLGVMSLNREKLAAAVQFLRSLDLSSVLANAIDDEASTQTSGPGGVSTPETKGSLLGRTKLPVPSGAPAAPLTVDLTGLESMHPPQKTSILYCEPSDPTHRLYPFCLAIQKLFKDEGFLVEDERKLKLHATLVNTIYSKGRKHPPKKESRPKEEKSSPEVASDAAHNHHSQARGFDPPAPLKIDARSILERYRNYVWVNDVVLDRIAICEMGAKKIIDDKGNVLDEEYTEVAHVALPTCQTTLPQ